MVRGEVLTGVERRRRWRYEDKVRIVDESFLLGARVSAVARRNVVAASLVFTWRRQAKLGEFGGGAPAPLLLPVELTSHPAAAPSMPMQPVSADDPLPQRRGPCGAGLIEIEIELAGGVKLRVDQDVDAAALDRVLTALSSR
jgi:transposase